MERNEKKIKILKVAERLFAENGFQGTSVRNIAEKAEINVAMISYYFGSKNNLLQELSVFRSSYFEVEVQTLLANKDGYLDKVDALIAFTIRRLHQNRRIYKIINFEYAKNSNEFDFTHFINQKKRNFKLIEAFIQQGQAQGIFSNTVNIPLIFRTISGTYFNLYYNKKSFEAMHPTAQNKSMDDFIEAELIPHVQRTIKALLTYEN